MKSICTLFTLLILSSPFFDVDARGSSKKGSPAKQRAQRARERGRDTAILSWWNEGAWQPGSHTAPQSAWLARHSQSPEPSITAHPPTKSSEETPERTKMQK